MQIESEFKELNENQYSLAPNGNRFVLPVREEYPAEFTRIKNLVIEQRALGREIVVVLGLGFVGAVMAAVIANAEDVSGKPSKFVIGVQRPSIRSYWKVGTINSGVSPFDTEDPKVQQYIHSTVHLKKTLVATYNEEVLKMADAVVVDIQCDYHKRVFGDVKQGEVHLEELKEALRTVGKYISRETLVLIETTVPPGTTEHIAYPIIKEAFTARNIAAEPLLAHSYERVMPGRDYVNSIQNFWRVCSGINETARQRVVKFLNEIINTRDFPLMVMDKPVESETAKIVENSYRATILAFMDEWSLFAEKNGIDITKIIKAVKVRPTHNNIMFPGPGIGGYCLPKDGALGMWSSRNIFGEEENILKMTAKAIDINDTRALHVIDLLQEAFSEVKKEIKNSRVTVLGVSYREDVGDTRNSGSEIIVRKLAELGVEISVHDPYVGNWPELEAGNGRSVFFTNQSRLNGLVIQKSIDDAVVGSDALLLCVPHHQYLNMFPDDIVRKMRSKNENHGVLTAPVIIDCFGILTDSQITRYLELGCIVKGLGRGHIKYLKKS